MDSVSGSLKQSEPCSPTSPGSPDPNGHHRCASPHIINRALNELQTGNVYMTITYDMFYISFKILQICGTVLHHR